MKRVNRILNDSPALSALARIPETKNQPSKTRMFGTYIATRSNNRARKTTRGAAMHYKIMRCHFSPRTQTLTHTVSAHLIQRADYYAYDVLFSALYIFSCWYSAQ